MDKAEFIDKAPLYYALAILNRLKKTNDSITIDQIESEFSEPDPNEPGEIICLVKGGRLFSLALDLLLHEGIIIVEPDDFGPPLIRGSDGYLQILSDQWSNKYPLYGKYIRVGRGRDSWLRQALVKVSIEESRLDLQNNDFDNIDQDWAPIPVDRDQPETTAVIAAVEDATEKIRSDNGYTANRPEERDYVVDGLTALARKLRESHSVSILYLRQYLIDPLKRASKSLGKSVAGLAIEVVKARLREWLMKQGFPWPFDWP